MQFDITFSLNIQWQEIYVRQGNVCDNGAWLRRDRPRTGNAHGARKIKTQTQKAKIRQKSDRRMNKYLNLEPSPNSPPTNRRSRWLEAFYDWVNIFVGTFLPPIPWGMLLTRETVHIRNPKARFKEFRTASLRFVISIYTKVILPRGSIPFKCRSR